MPLLKYILLENEKNLRDKKEIIQRLKSCARKGVIIAPNSYNEEAVSYLDEIPFNPQELNALISSMNHGVGVCQRKRLPGSDEIYSNLMDYFSNRLASCKH